MSNAQLNAPVRRGRPSCRACGGAECPACWEVTEQARDWVALKCEPLRRANGDPQDSHGELFKAAMICVEGFALGYAAARSVLVEYCGSSDLPWQDREIDHKLTQAEKAAGVRGNLIFKKRGDGDWKRKETPREEEKASRRQLEWQKAVPFDRGVLAGLQVPVRTDFDWWRRRSAADPWALEVEEFFNGLYLPGERVLLFSEFRSQGDFIYVVPDGTKHGGWWLPGRQPKESAVRCDRPRAAQRVGMWFLAQPVTGRWGWSGTGEGRKLTRRSGENVTAWRYMVIESDEPGIEDLWLNFLAQLPLKIVALYTSGGRSVHALVRVDAGSKAEWDGMRDAVRPLLTKCGADKGVFSAVRLTRCPGFVRMGSEHDGKYVKYEKPRMQRLLYWNPGADGRPALAAGDLKFEI